MQLPEFIYPNWQVSQKIQVFCTTNGTATNTTENTQQDKKGLGVYGFNTANHVQDNILAVTQARDLLQAYIKKPINWLNQVHGNAVSTTFSPEQNFDASITKNSDYALAIQTADCLPIVLADINGGEVANLHCGWRGLANGIIKNCVKKMQTPKQDICVWFAPCISADNYEVSADVWDSITQIDIDFAKSFAPSPYRLNHYQLDLVELAKIQLEKLGIDNFYYSGLCTYDDTRLYSYRQNRQTGRIATLAFIK